MSQGRNLLRPATSRCASLLSLAAIGLGFLLTAASQAAPTFLFKGSLGTVKSPDITEASGIMASRQNSGVLWTHNDSHDAGGGVFALTTDGFLLGHYSIFPMPSSPANYEDLAIGPGPTPGVQYLYLGDIGDNYQTRSTVRVFRFPEPAVSLKDTNSPVTALIRGAESITLMYPPVLGPQNAEAMMVDPIHGDLYIATKTLTGSQIFLARRQELNIGYVFLTYLRDVPFAKVSGGDISPDGRMIALRRGNTAGVWTRPPGMSVDDALGGAGVGIPIVGEPLELNGEAIGFHPTSLGYYTISEGNHQPIYFFRRTDTGAPRQPVTFIQAGDIWRYRDLGSDENTAWRQPGFDDSTWGLGIAQFGYGQGDEHTSVSSGPSGTNKYVTTYFRRQFTASPATVLNNLGLRLLFTDGVIVYLNGVEVFRQNLPSDPAFDLLATGSNSSLQNTWVSAAIDESYLHVGANTIAVEVHRQLSDGLDLSFDLQLIQGAFDLSPNLNATDNRAPTVSFTGPPANAVVTDETLSVFGTASDNVGVAKVAFSVNASTFQPAQGTTAWLAHVPLAIGSNVVSVVAYDSSSNVSAIVSRKFVRLAASPLALDVTGAGTVTPNLDGSRLVLGKSYVVTAKPVLRNLFTGWTGDIVASGLRLQFLMQSNLTLHATFVTNPFVATKGIYRGLFEDTNQPSHQRSGALVATVAENGKFTAALRFGGKSVSLSGQMGLDGKAMKVVSVQATNLLTVTLCLDLADGSDRLTGSIDGANWNAPLLAFRSPTYGKTNPAPFAGRYTMFIAGDTNLIGPPGHSVGTMVVSPTGVLTLSGTLADGVSLAQSGPVSRDGWWPFYVPLYGGKGSVLSWLMLTNDVTESIRGQVNWIKPAVPTDKLYPDGFTNIAAAVGSTYSTLMMTNFLATNPNPCLVVTGFAPGLQTNCVVLGPGYAWNGPGVKSLKLSLPTGLWSGTYTNPVNGRPLPAKFTFLLQSGSGYGYVLNTNISAAIEQSPAPHE